MTAVFKLPAFIDVPHWDARIDIDGTVYTFVFRWQARGGVWHVDLYDELGVTPIRNEQRLIPLVNDSGSEDSLIALAEADVARGDPPGTTVAQLCLFPGAFPGLLLARSGRPLQRHIEDLQEVEILYFDAGIVAAIQAEVEA